MSSSYQVTCHHLIRWHVIFLSGGMLSSYQVNVIILSGAMLSSYHVACYRIRWHVIMRKVILSGGMLSSYQMASYLIRLHVILSGFRFNTCICKTTWVWNQGFPVCTRHINTVFCWLPYPYKINFLWDV